MLASENDTFEDVIDYLENNGLLELTVNTTASPTDEDSAVATIVAVIIHLSIVAIGCRCVYVYIREKCITSRCHRILLYLLACFATLAHSALCILLPLWKADIISAVALAMFTLYYCFCMRNADEQSFIEDGDFTWTVSSENKHFDRILATLPPDIIRRIIVADGASTEIMRRISPLWSVLVDAFLRDRKRLPVLNVCQLLSEEGTRVDLVVYISTAHANYIEKWTDVWRKLPNKGPFIRIWRQWMINEDRRNTDDEISFEISRTLLRFRSINQLEIHNGCRKTRWIIANALRKEIEVNNLFIKTPIFGYDHRFFVLDIIKNHRIAYLQIRACHCRTDFFRDYLLTIKPSEDKKKDLTAHCGLSPCVSLSFFSSRFPSLPHSSAMQEAPSTAKDSTPWDLVLNRRNTATRKRSQSRTLPM